MHFELDGCNMALWKFLDYRTDDWPARNLIQVWYGEQDSDVRAEFDATVAILAVTEDWTKVKGFKVLTKRHFGLAELRFFVKSEKHGKKVIRRFRPVGIWREKEREFVFLVGCEKSGATYTPTNAFDLALEFKAKLERGNGGTCEHY